MTTESNVTRATVESTALWSVFAYVVVAIPVLLCQFLVRRSAYFRPINEFLCSFLWTSWSLECVVIGYTGSTSLTFIILFLRLLVPPYVFRGAYFNPCGALYEYGCQEKGFRRRQHLQQLFNNIAIEVTATFFACVYSYIVWNILGSTISVDHQQFLLVKPDYFLQVPILSGFLLEFLLTFVCWMPKLLMKDSFYMVLVQACLVVYLVFQFEGSTGAFMNPVTALSFVLTWHRLGAVEHFIVYWVGPLLGTALAVAIARYREREHKRMD